MRGIGIVEDRTKLHAEFIVRALLALVRGLGELIPSSSSDVYPRVDRNRDYGGVSTPTATADPGGCEAIPARR